MPKYVVPFTEVEQKTMIDLYEGGFALACISKMIGYDCSRINRFLKKKGIRLRKRSEYRKYSVNHDYFENINSKEKAVMLGLLYADGCNDKKHNYIKISLQQGDKETLEIFNKCLDSNYNIKCYDRIRIRKGKEKIEKVASLVISSKKMCEDLNNLGCVPRKSLIKKFPKLQDPEFIKSFIYGYFLGNGSLCIRTNLSFVAHITSTKNMCQHFQKYFRDIGVHSSICLKKGSKNMRIIYISGNEGIKKAMDWLFGNEIYLMKRKYDKYNRLVNIYDQKQLKKAE